MSQQTSTFLLRGGLNLVTPPIAIPAGQVIAAINYEPDISGYSRVGGFERFDGHARPSDSDDAATIAARRAAIAAVPGTGPVRGVQVFDGHVYAFRDHADGDGRMYRDSATGWEQMTFGSVLNFDTGTVEFLEGETLVGGTSGATASIERVVLRSGAWSGTATGYLVLSNVSGTFQAAETITDSAMGSADATDAQAAITLAAGGYYDFTTHNFYGAAKRPRLYGVNGQGNGFEWTGEVLSPILTGTAAGVLADVSYLLAANGDFILAANGDSIILRGEFDRPMWVRHFQNHLFLGYESGSLINSSIGEPLEYITTTGAGEVSFGEAITGLLASAATALVIFGRNKIDYLTGTDADTFLLQSISDSAGAVPYSAQLMDSPTYLDDGGIRKLSTTSAFGDWRMGTVSQMVEPLMKAKRDAGVGVAASMKVKGKDQYRIYWDDGSGVILYIGRKDPEVMPIKLTIDVFCACSGEVSIGAGDRLFVGADDGYVYELDRGRSFDGAAIAAYLRLVFNSIGSPTQNKVFKKASIDVLCEDDIDVGLAFDIDYAAGLGASQVDVDVAAGSTMITTDVYDDIDWTQPVQGRLEKHIAGFGLNIAVTLITEAADKRPHTFPSATFNFTPRGLDR